MRPSSGISALKTQFRAILILLATVLLVTSGHFFGMPVHAAKTPTLYISPSSQPLAPAGSTVTYNVNVSDISPLQPLAGWEIYVRDNNSVLSPVDFTVSSSLGPGFEGAHCVNNVGPGGGVGTGCSANDAAPGTVHSAFSLFGNPVSGNITLFTITYKAVRGPYTLVYFLQPGSSTILFDIHPVAISFTPVFGSYGNVPALPEASFNWTPLRPFEGDRVIFNASSSTTPPGTKLVDYFWVFSAGGLPLEEASGVITSKVFMAANWTVTLLVRNDWGVSSLPTAQSLLVEVKPSTDLGIFLNPGFGDRILLPGALLTFEVYVENNGTTTVEGFNVSLSVPRQVFTALPYPYPLAPNHEAGFRFTWNTTLVQPGTYTIDARVAPLVNETNIANNDAFLTVTFVPYMIITDEFDFIQPTSPHQHELTTNVTLESGAGFAGTVTLTSPSISGLSIGFGSSSLSLASDSFAVTTMTIKIGEKATPGFYRLPVFAASGSFNFSSRVSAIVPSKDVTMPHLTWSETIAANGLQTWVATVSNTLSTPVEVFLDITCSTPQYRGQFGCAYSYDIIVAGKSKTTLTVSSLFGVFAGQNLPSSVKFTASLFFFDPRGGLLLSSDVLTGTFTIVP